MDANPDHLVDLIASRQTDELLSLVTLEEIAEAWCRYTALPYVSGIDVDDPDKWSIHFVMGDGIDMLDEPRARLFLDLLIDRASADDVLVTIGAGPLEEFAAKADDDRVEWIEQRAAASPRFRRALRHISLPAIRLDRLSRLEHAAGLPLTPLTEATVDYAPGDLPGTVNVISNGEVIHELECEPSQVDTTIRILRRRGTSEN